MRLGGYVIHGNGADTLGRCLDSLLSVCDEVVAVDSGSTDGSADLVRARGLRSANLPWQGYGAARERAVGLLGPADFVFFLDSDEHLEPASIERLRSWKRGVPSAPYYRVALRDWAELSGRRFLFRTESHVRLYRRDAARWTREMIVHESLPKVAGPVAMLDGAVVEHRFATSVEGREEKERRYALLWALRAFVEGRRGKWPALQRPAHAARNAILKGAALRGGMDGLRLAWGVGRYHALKHQLLRELRAGAHPEKVAALREGRLEELFRMV